MNLRKFIRNWFYHKDLKDALYYVGLKVSGSMDDLIDRLRFEAKWSLSDFLDFMTDDELKEICRFYGLTVGGRKGDRVRRIYEFVTGDWKSHDWDIERRIQRSGMHAYKVFIAYRRDTGLDFADHLRKGLERECISAFLDVVDIPKEFRGKQTWIRTRNDAIKNSERFLFIVTQGVETSKELRKEIQIARDNDKTFLVYRYHTLSPQITIKLEEETMNLGEFQQISFDSKEDLLRKVLTTSRQPV